MAAQAVALSGARAELAERIAASLGTQRKAFGTFYASSGSQMMPGDALW
jgi:hypothetical protein